MTLPANWTTEVPAAKSVQEGRNAVGFELKESYHALAVRYVERAMETAPLDQGRLL